MKRVRRDTRTRASDIFRPEPNLARLCDDPQFIIERCGTNESYFVELLPTRQLYRQVFHQTPHVNVFCVSGKDVSVVTVELSGDAEVKKGTFGSCGQLQPRTNLTFSSALILTVRRGYQTATVSLDVAPVTPSRRRSLSRSESPNSRRRSISRPSPKKELSTEHKILQSVQSTVRCVSCVSFSSVVPMLTFLSFGSGFRAATATFTIHRRFRLNFSCSSAKLRTTRKTFASEWHTPKRAKLLKQSSLPTRLRNAVHG